MRTVSTYLEQALERSNLENHSEISRRIGVKPSAITRFKLGHALPTDENMLKLADLAGIEHAEALLDLNRWRAKSEEAKSVYVELAKRLGYLPAIALALAVFMAPGDANATGTNGHSISHGNAPTYQLCGFWRRLRARFWQALRRVYHITSRCFLSLTPIPAK